jgi:hypothetical protein
VAQIGLIEMNMLDTLLDQVVPDAMQTSFILGG